MNKRNLHVIHIITSNSSASGKTITVAADVCVRDLESLFEVHVAHGEHQLQTLAFHTSSPVTSKSPL
jgi:hypothetical protein